MKKCFYFLLLIFSLSNAFAQKDSLAYIKLENRLKFLEDYKLTIDKYASAEVKEIKNQQRAFEIGYQNRLWWFEHVLSFFLGSLLTGVAGWFLLKKRADAIFDEKIGKLYEGNSVEFKNIISKSSEESNIRREKNILILSKNKGSEVHDLLDSQGFKKLTHQQYAFSSTGILSSLEKFDMVIIDGNEYNLSEIKKELLQVMHQIIETDTMIFFFGGNIPELFEPENKPLKDRMTSSNFKTQIVGNLINMLKYN